MGLYESLGIRPVINAAGTYTAVGGSKMSAETLSAMCEAAQSFVPLEELLTKLNEKTAELTGNEGAFLCNSCSTALFLAVSACISKRWGKPIHYLPKEQIASSQVIAFWGQHIPYDFAITQTGAELKFVGRDARSTVAMADEELEMNISDRTVCIYFASRTPRGYFGPGCMNLEDVLRIAGKYDIPVLVDCAAQLPPKSNLWEFTQMGATFAAFSGGKDLCGPQASGLLVGKKDYMDIVSKIGFPRYSVGRLMKIGREELVALYMAIKTYVESDEEARLRKCEAECKLLLDRLKSSSAYSAYRTWPNQAGQPLPRVFVELRERVDLTPEELRQKLMEGDRPIYAISENQNGVYINPMCLYDGEMEIIAQRLLQIEGEL